MSSILRSPCEGPSSFPAATPPNLPLPSPDKCTSLQSMKWMWRQLFLGAMQACAELKCVALQELWCGTKRMDGTFLHSPLLDEMKSLEIMLMRQAYRQRRAGQEGTADGSVGSSAAVQSAIAKAPSVSVDLPSQVQRQPACSSAFLSSGLQVTASPQGSMLHGSPNWAARIVC